MKISNLNALKETLIASKNTLVFMDADLVKVNGLIDARDYVQMALDDLKTDGLVEGRLSAVQSLEQAVKKLQRIEKYANEDLAKRSNVIDELIRAQCLAIIPMIDRVIEGALAE